jgi:hypothetical protein
MNESEQNAGTPENASSLHEDDMRLTVGRKVRSGVWVGGTWQPMALGIIVAVHSGYCDVDIMGLHGGAPWVVQYTNTSLRAEPHID